MCRNQCRTVPLVGTASEPGPTGLRLGKNLRDIRGRTSVRELSTRMRDLGRPLFPSAISKIENGQRRVDADELVALAIALDCTPNRLLIGPQADDEEIRLVEERIALPMTEGADPVEVDIEPSRRDAWRWARGGEPLHMGPFVMVGDDEQTEFAETFAKQTERRRRFQRENRPDDVPDATDYGTLPVELRAVLDTVVEASLQPLLDAHGRGLRWKAIARYMKLHVDRALWEQEAAETALEDTAKNLARYKRISLDEARRKVYGRAGIEPPEQTGGAQE